MLEQREYIYINLCGDVLLDEVVRLRCEDYE
jgi:hypothetical protein